MILMIDDVNEKIYFELFVFCFNINIAETKE